MPLEKRDIYKEQNNYNAVAVTSGSRMLFQIRRHVDTRLYLWKTLGETSIPSSPGVIGTRHDERKLGSVSLGLALLDSPFFSLEFVDVLNSKSSADLIWIHQPHVDNQSSIPLYGMQGRTGT